MTGDRPAVPPVVPGGLELAPGVYVPESAVRIAFSRSGGPGGQNVNKVSSKAEIWLRLDALTTIHPEAVERLKKLAGRRITDAGELHVISETERSQSQNREEALLRIRQLLIDAMRRPKKRKVTRPSKASKQRRLDSKKKRSATKSNRRGDAE